MKSFRLRRASISVTVVAAFFLSAAAAQTSPRMSASQPLFTVMAALNACGYDAGLGQALPMRAQIRDELLAATRSDPARQALQNFCADYARHDSAANNVASYVSLALNLDDSLALRTAENELPPDAVAVFAALPLLQKLNRAADLNRLWQAHQTQYESLIEQLHRPVQQTLRDTDLYLRRTQSGPQAFVLYVEPQIASGEVNSRNYGDHYALVLSPTTNAAKMTQHLAQLRHVYLHYIFDPMLQKRASTLARLEPLTALLQDAPLDDSYREDVGRLVTESLIKAVEARLEGGRKGPIAAKQAAVTLAARQGFLLTPYFYDQLTTFEADPVSVEQAYPDWLYGIDVAAIRKFAATVQFLPATDPDPLRLSRQTSISLAERAWASGNLDAAADYAKQALARKEDEGRAQFVLARVAIAHNRRDEAQQAFQRAAQTATDARIRAWSNIYLGRLLDLQQRRAEALEHYRAAQADAATAELQAAAARGLQQPYRPTLPHEAAPPSNHASQHAD